MNNDIFTLKKYLNNPDGSSNAVGIGLQPIKNQYNDELKKIERNMSIKWYTNAKRDTLCAHIILPSQSNEFVQYDIVFEFQLGENREYGEYLLDYPVRIFSNSPSFVYSYAYMFYKDKRLVPWLLGKYPPATLQNPPVNKNPNKQIKFERSLYLAAAYIQNKRDYLPLAVNTARILPSITKVKDYVNTMDQLDVKRKQESYLKSQEKLYETKRMEYQNAAKRVKSNAAPSKPVKATTSSTTKKPKGTTSGVKKTKGTKKPKKGIK